MAMEGRPELGGESPLSTSREKEVLGSTSTARRVSGVQFFDILLILPFLHDLDTDFQTAVGLPMTFGEARHRF